jgi:hypothetical protein
MALNIRMNCDKRKEKYVKGSSWTSWRYYPSPSVQGLRKTSVKTAGFRDVLQPSIYHTREVSQSQPRLVLKDMFVLLKQNI